MLNISINRLLDIWTELEDALAGKNSWGGEVAEIYVYRVIDKAFPLEPNLEDEKQGLKTLRNIFELFTSKRDCFILVETVDGFVDFKFWNPESFYHRYHIWVKR